MKKIYLLLILCSLPYFNLNKAIAQEYDYYNEKNRLLDRQEQLIRDGYNAAKWGPIQPLLGLFSDKYDLDKINGELAANDYSLYSNDIKANSLNQVRLNQEYGNIGFNPLVIEAIKPIDKLQPSYTSTFDNEIEYNYPQYKCGYDYICGYKNKCEDEYICDNKYICENIRKCDEDYNCNYEHNCGYKYKCGYENKCRNRWNCGMEWICK